MLVLRDALLIHYVLPMAEVVAQTIGNH